MKKLLLIAAFGIMLMFTLTGCSKEPEFDIEEELKDEIQADAMVEVAFNYADVKNVLTNITDIENEDDTYTAKGKVTVIDNYGDNYVGKITGEYRFNETSKSFSKVSLDIETPKKQ